MDRPIPSAIPKNDSEGARHDREKPIPTARALILIKSLNSSHRERQTDRRGVLPRATTTRRSPDPLIASSSSPPLQPRLPWPSSVLLAAWDASCRTCREKSYLASIACRPCPSVNSPKRCHSISSNLLEFPILSD